MASSTQRPVFMAGKILKQGGLSGRFARRNIQVVPGLILYSQVFRPGKAKIVLQGAQLLTDPTDDRLFIVKEPSHADPDKKNKINPAKDHRFQASNRVSRDQWLRALNQAMAPAATSGAVAQGGPLERVGGAAGPTNVPQPFPTAPGFQQLMLIVPPGVRVGQSFMFRAMGQTFSTTCPQGKNPGDRIDVRIPIPQQQHQTRQQAAASAAIAAAAAANPTSGPRYPPPASQTQWQQPQVSQPVRMRVQARPDNAASGAAPHRVRVRARADGAESTATPSAPAFDALNPDVVSSQQEARDIALAIQASMADAPPELSRPPSFGQREPSLNPAWEASTASAVQHPATPAGVNPDWVSDQPRRSAAEDLDEDLRLALELSKLDTGGVPETLVRMDNLDAPPTYDEAMAAEQVMSPPHYHLGHSSEFAEQPPPPSAAPKPSHPDELVCPITQDLFEDPVITPAGHSYSRVALLAHVRAGGSCPMSGVPLEEDDLYDNALLAEIVDDYREETLDDTGHPRPRSLREMAASSIQHRYSTLCDSGREPIDHLTDPITFELFEDPVVTKYGRTYSRVTIESCIEKEGQDPLVRRSLANSDPLYPNLAVQKMLEIYESGPSSPSASYSAPPTPGGVFEGDATSEYDAGMSPNDLGLAPDGHSPETIRLVHEVCRLFPNMEQRVGQVLETLTPPLLGTLVEICGRDQRFVVMSFLQNGLDLQRTQDFIVDTLNTIS